MHILDKSASSKACLSAPIVTTLHVQFLHKESVWQDSAHLEFEVLDGVAHGN